jgi:hypothetical protein
MMAIRGRKLTLALLLASAATLVLASSPAAAGTYTVMSCHDRTGAPAPISDASGGWAPGNSGQLGLASIDHCSGSGGDLYAVVAGPWPYPVGARAWWRFQPPAATTIDGYAIRYSAYTRPWNNQNEGLINVLGSASGYSVSLAGAGYSPPSWVSVTGAHDTNLQVHAQCDGPIGSPNCDPGRTHAEIHVQRSEITLSDTQPPEAPSATGSAVASATWQGTQVFAFPATDEGGGVYQAILEVDGAPVMTRTIDEWGGRCVDTTAGGRVFRYPRPCLTAVDALVPFDSAMLPVGDHDVALRISDAAGNLRTVYAARKTIVVPVRRIGPGSDPAERGAANGVSAADDARLTARWTRTRRPTLTAAYGRRNVIRGRLTTRSGAGIRNARVELLSAIDGRGGPPLDKGGARTRRDGRFTLILPANASSRTLVLRYRSHANETVSTAEATLRIRVKAGVRLSGDPHLAARGRTVKLSGQLLGRPLPATGKVVELQARSPGERWITFRTVRASRRGRFAARHTVRQSGPALYLIRARVREADDYPYATGVSRSVRVKVR